LAKTAQWRIKTCQEIFMSDNELNGAEALAEALLQQGLDTLYALPGAQLDPFFSALYDRQDRFRLFTSRHEQGAAYMAYGAARSTGKPNAFAVVPGPGWLNASAAMATAFGANTPVISLSGQIPLDLINQGLGEMHEIEDQVGMAARLSKYAHLIQTPQEAPLAVSDAFNHLSHGRPRPVYLEMPPDVMLQKSRFDTVLPAPSEVLTHPVVDTAQLQQAVDLLVKAKNPMIFVGGGAQHSGAQVKMLAEHLQAPVSAFRSGRGVVDYRDPLSILWSNAHELWKTADVVLAVGTRLDFPRRMWGESADLKIIRIDIDPAEMQRISEPAVKLVGDSAAVLDALIPALQSDCAPRTSRADEFQQMKAAVEADMRQKVAPQMEFLQAIRDVLPEDGFFVDEMTQVGYTSWAWFPTYKPRRYITSGFQSTLGYGYPTSLGVQAANPDAAVVSVSGDGGFMFGASELATAMKYDLPVVAIVFKDNKFGNVQRIQRERYNGRVIGSDLYNPDFVKLANSFDMHSVRCESPIELRGALDSALQARKPALIEVPVGDLPSAWPYIVRPKVRGV
jgi:acetolactate synthase I/II/III large subunit